MRKAFLLCVLAVILITSSASAQQAACTRDSFFPEAGNCGYDVSDYKLDMTWDVNGDRWDVVEDITFTSEWDTDELHFDFTDSYEIYGMTIDGVAVDFTLKEGDLTIRYPFAHDTEYHLYAGFRGKLNYGLLTDEDGEKREENSGFCMVNEPTNAWRFYVCNDHPKDRATYHYSFTVPASFTPAGVGRLLEIREADGTIIHPEGEFSREAGPEGAEGTVTFTYEAAEPMAPYLFSVCAFSYDMKQKTLENGIVELDFVDNSLGSQYEYAWELSNQQEDIIRMFESYLGKYPYRDLGAIVSPTWLGAALETQTRPLYDLTTLSGDVFAHELMHQWFGDLISLEDWSDIWIKEGAATFGEYLYQLHFEGQEAYEDLLKENYEIIAGGGRSVYDMDNEDIEDWFRFTVEGRETSAYDRELALDAAESFCRVDEDGNIWAGRDSISLPEGDTVTLDQWLDAMKASCRTISMNSRSFGKFEKMAGANPGENLYIDHFAGPKEITNSIKDVYGHSSYYGGSFVYYALQDRLGDDLFKQAIQTLLERYQYSTVNEEKFIAVFSETAGEDLTDFIRAWLYYGENHVPDLPGLMTYEEARLR